MKNEYIFDIECDGLNPTKIHVLSTMSVEYGWIESTQDYDKMREFFQNRDVTLVGHNIIRFDIPVVERILGIKVLCKVIDTLPLSWYLEFDRPRHGLEWWGETFGVEKPKVEDWHNLSYDDYRHRCEQDVSINAQLYTLCLNKLNKLYEGDDSAKEKCVNYLMFKMRCAAEQERSRWKLDVERAKEELSKMEAEKEDKTEQLKDAMPQVEKVSTKKRPEKPYKKDGSLSSAGERWFALLREQGLAEDYVGSVDVTTGYKEPNPNSHDQIKDWLYSLGWKPDVFKFVRNKTTGDVREIPQINGDEGVSPSVKKLFAKEPRLELLDGLSILSHRISILRGFLDNVDDDGYVRAEVQGITNTLRFKHAVCVNLPGVDKPYGSIIRGVLTAPEGYELCGSDMSGLENRIGHHYMWKFDAPYVRKQMAADYDPHIEMCVTAGMITEKEAELYKQTKDKRIHEIRKKGKDAVYACAYGAGAQAIARQADIPLKDAKKLHEVYWKLNWSMKKVPMAITTKTEFGTMWLLNPVSNLWYQLRDQKDIWNTLVQGSGVWAFDMWVAFIRSKRPQLTAQFHDEVVLTVKKGYREDCEKLLRWAIAATNKKLGLNRQLDIDVQFGDTYAEIH